MTLLSRRDNPFEILFRNFFDNDSFFNDVAQCNIKYPVDIYENETGLQIEIAAVGLDKNEININIEEGNILRVFYEKNPPVKEGQEDSGYIHRGIARRSFNMGWKIGKTFNIEALEASLDKGLLTITIPSAPKVESKKIDINIPNQQTKI